MSGDIQLHNTLTNLYIHFAGEIEEYQRLGKKALEEYACPIREWLASSDAPTGVEAQMLATALLGEVQFRNKPMWFGLLDEGVVPSWSQMRGEILCRKAGTLIMKRYEKNQELVRSALMLLFILENHERFDFPDSYTANDTTDDEEE